MFYHEKKESYGVNKSIEVLNENEEHGGLYEGIEERSLVKEGIQDKGEGVLRNEMIQDDVNGECMSGETLGSWADGVMVYQGGVRRGDME